MHAGPVLAPLEDIVRRRPLEDQVAVLRRERFEPYALADRARGDMLDPIVRGASTDDAEVVSRRPDWDGRIRHVKEELGDRKLKNRLSQ